MVNKINLNVPILKSLKSIKEALQNQREKGEKSKLVKAQAKEKEMTATQRKRDNRECL